MAFAALHDLDVSPTRIVQINIAATSNSVCHSSASQILSVPAVGFAAGRAVSRHCIARATRTAATSRDRRASIACVRSKAVAPPTRTAPISNRPALAGFASTGRCPSAPTTRAADLGGNAISASVSRNRSVPRSRAPIPRFVIKASADPSPSATAQANARRQTTRAKMVAANSSADAWTAAPVLRSIRASIRAAFSSGSAGRRATAPPSTSACSVAAASLANVPQASHAQTPRHVLLASVRLRPAVATATVRPIQCATCRRARACLRSNARRLVTVR